MKNYAFVFAYLGLVLVGQHSSLAQSQLYTSAGFENIFAFSNIDQSNADVSYTQDARYSIAFNIQSNVNYDFNHIIGMYSGVALRNVGLAFQGEGLNPMKHRSYSLGIPIGLKIGSLERGFFVFGGAEYEWMFAYKQKEYIGDDKFIRSEWFSDRVNRFIPSIFAGISFPGGISVSFKYYLNDFLNKDFVDDFGNRPFQQFDTQMFYVSIGFNLFELEEIISD